MRSVDLVRPRDDVHPPLLGHSRLEGRVDNLLLRLLIMRLAPRPSTSTRRPLRSARFPAAAARRHGLSRAAPLPLPLRLPPLLRHVLPGGMLGLDPPLLQHQAEPHRHPECGESLRAEVGRVGGRNAQPTEQHGLKLLGAQLGVA